MTIEDVKKIAIEEYGIKEENLILERDGDDFYCYSTIEQKSFHVKSKENVIIPVPR